MKNFPNCSITNTAQVLFCTALSYPRDKIRSSKDGHLIQGSTCMNRYFELWHMSRLIQFNSCQICQINYWCSSINVQCQYAHRVSVCLVGGAGANHETLSTQGPVFHLCCSFAVIFFIVSQFLNIMCRDTLYFCKNYLHLTKGMPSCIMSVTFNIFCFMHSWYLLKALKLDRA